MPSFQGQVIAITGAASGIGLAVAKHLASMGAKLSLTDSSRNALEEAANSIAAGFGQDRLFHHVADVRDAAAVHVGIEKTVNVFGRLDGAVNAAGTHPVGSGTQPIWDISDENWQFAQDVNVKGMFNCVRAQLKYLVGADVQSRSSSPSIVVFGSTWSLTSGANASAYATSKHAVIGLTRAAAMDAAPYGIRVNAVCPGPIDTPMLRGALPPEQIDALAAAIPMKRLGQTSEVVSLVCYLLSEQASYTTGAIHVVEGRMIVS